MEISHAMPYVFLLSWLMMLFNRLRAFRRAWDLGWRALGGGAFSEERFQAWFQHNFEIALKLCQNVCQTGPGGVLEASWRALGALKKAW